MRQFFKSMLCRSTAPKLVRILPQDVTVEVATGQSVLEAALAHGVAYPHNCTVGTCGSCKTRLKGGRVREATPFGYTLSKQELDAGYILACQAMPRGDLTVVEIPAPGAEMPQMQSVGGRIVATQALTHDILRVTLQVDRPIDYVAGQYASVTAPGMARSRHYSFADAPQRGGRTDLSFFIRKVPGGKFTEALFAGGLQGMPLQVQAPQGTFHLRAGNFPMVCVAGGSGLAPLLSILEDARKNRIRRPCTLLLGVRTQDDLYMMDAIQSLASAWPDAFRFVPVLSHEPVDSDWQGARGWVSDFLSLPSTTDSWADAEAYMCGPPLMIDAAIERLIDAGMSFEAIHYDKFVDGPPELSAAVSPPMSVPL